MRAQLGLARSRTRPQHDQGHRTRAEALVGAPDDAGLEHGRVLVQSGLDLRGVDVLAAAHDQVAAPVEHARPPSASSRPTSPVCSQPSRSVRAVAAGSPT